MGTRSNKQYTEEFRLSSAKMAVESNQPIAAITRDLGIHDGTLYGWVAKYYPDRQQSPDSDDKTELSEELKRLRKENARLRMERDILKKATAYFAGESL